MNGPGGVAGPAALLLALVAAAGTVSWQNGHVLTGASGAGRSTRRMMRNTTKATMTKSTTVPMKVP